MSFRNISAWSIRNPVPPIVLFFMLTVAGIVSFMRDGREQRSGHRFPGRVIVDQPARRRADRAREPGHPEGRIAVRSLQGIDEINSTVTEGSRRRSSSSHRHADRPRGRGRAQRGPADPRRPARRHPRAAGRPRQHGSGNDSPASPRRSHRHDDRAAELVHRQHRRQGAARRFPAWRRSAATAASIARSASSSIPPSCSRRASPRARSTSSCAR
jgi:hypothetical protein